MNNKKTGEGFTNACPRERVASYEATDGKQERLFDNTWWPEAVCRAALELPAPLE